MVRKIVLNLNSPTPPSFLLDYSILLDFNSRSYSRRSLSDNREGWLLERRTCILIFFTLNRRDSSIYATDRNNPPSPNLKKKKPRGPEKEDVIVYHDHTPPSVLLLFLCMCLRGANYRRRIFGSSSSTVLSLNTERVVSTLGVRDVRLMCSV